MKFRIANREISEETTQIHVKGFFNLAVGQAESRSYNLHDRVCVCVLSGDLCGWGIRAELVDDEIEPEAEISGEVSTEGGFLVTEVQIFAERVGE